MLLKPLLQSDKLVLIYFFLNWGKLCNQRRSLEFFFPCQLNYCYFILEVEISKFLLESKTSAMSYSFSILRIITRVWNVYIYLSKPCPGPGKFLQILLPSQGQNFFILHHALPFSFISTEIKLHLLDGRYFLSLQKSINFK
jgi:hypothetical protein